MLDGIFGQVTAPEQCRKVATATLDTPSSGDMSSPIPIPTAVVDGTISTPQSAGYSFSQRSSLRTPSSGKDRTTRSATSLGSPNLAKTPATPAQQLPVLYMIVFDEIDALGS